MSFRALVLTAIMSFGLATFGNVGCSNKNDEEDARRSGVGGGRSGGGSNMASAGSAGTTGASAGGALASGSSGAGENHAGSAGKGATGGGGNASASGGSGKGSSGGTGNSSAGSLGASGGNGGNTAGGSGSSAGGAGESAGVHAAASLDIRTASGCMLMPEILDLPQVDGGHPVDENGASHPIADATETPEGSFSVLCDASSGTFDALITNTTTGESTAVAFPRSMSSGAITFYVTPAKGSEYKGPDDMRCTGTVLMATKTSFLLKFSCESLVATDDAVSGSCTLGESYLYFDGCTAP